MPLKRTFGFIVSGYRIGVFTCRLVCFPVLPSLSNYGRNLLCGFPIPEIRIPKGSQSAYVLGYRRSSELITLDSGSAETNCNAAPVDHSNDKRMSSYTRFGCN